MFEVREDLPLAASTLVTPLTLVTPAAHAAARRPTGRPSQAAGSARSDELTTRTRPRVVLIAEDYEDTRALYAEHLASAGFQVLEASDGEQAVALALAKRPDAIVMDLSMPKVDGWEATRRIRAVEALTETYILVLSAMDGETSRSMAFDAGCNDFVRKPFLGAALAEVLVGHFRTLDADAAAAAARSADAAAADRADDPAVVPSAPAPLSTAPTTTSAAPESRSARRPAPSRKSRRPAPRRRR
jgi:two-component system cell cycle response regulator DivK